MTRDEWNILQPVLAAVIDGNLQQDQAINRIRTHHPELESSMLGLLRAWREKGAFLEPTIRPPFCLSQKKAKPEDAKTALPGKPAVDS